jgi:hypothetical protein
LCLYLVQLLQQNLLARFAYPVIIFHDGLSDAQASKIRAAGPAAIRFELINLRVLPPCLSEGRLEQLIGNLAVDDPTSQLAQARNKKDLGYRYMIRWWGWIGELSALGPYDFVMRLDTDSFLINPVAVDPFMAMAEGGHAITHLSRVPAYASP